MMERDSSPGQQTNPPRPGSTLSRIELERTQGVEPCTYGLEGRRVPTNTWLALPLILTLSACASKPVIVTETIHVPTWIPYPATLIQPITVNLQGMTYGQALGSLNAGLQTCDGQLESIKDLKVPPKTP